GSGRRRYIRARAHMSLVRLDHPRAALLTFDATVEEPLDHLAVGAHENVVRKRAEERDGLPLRGVWSQRIVADDVEPQCPCQWLDALDAADERARDDRRDRDRAQRTYEAARISTADG